MKYKLIKAVYKLSDKKIYNVGEEVELNIEDAVSLMKDGFIEVIDQPKTASEKMTDFKTKTTKKAK